MGKKRSQKFDSVFTFLGSLCQTEPCEPEKTQFQTTTEEMFESQELNKDSAKLKLNIKMYGLKGRTRESEREGRNGPGKQPHQW